MALSPNGRWLVVASAGADMLSVIDTRNDQMVETFSARQNPGDLFGAQQQFTHNAAPPRV
jgi:DNA-binding beta-propeller fold protein YncE